MALRGVDNLIRVSLEIVYPEIAKEWHPTKNGDLFPAQVSYGSGKKVWWLCNKGHEWMAAISNRISGAGCPYCSGRYAILGENDLATMHPELVAEWHPTKNGELIPEGLTRSSEKKVWWLCSKGHEWEATIHCRTTGASCPYCAGKKILPGVNDLATMNPILATEWHPVKNGSLRPDMVMEKADKKVWWLCSVCSHEWQSKISQRSNGTGCPECAKAVRNDSRNKTIIQKYGSLTTVYPEIAAEWHPTKNGQLTPTDVTKGSYKKVWWLCKCGHEWQSAVINRTRKNGTGCPSCAKRVRVKTPVNGP